MSRPEQPPSSEEMAEITKSQKKTQKEMISAGAQWKADKEGEPVLEVTAKQIEDARKDMMFANKEMLKQEVTRKLEKIPETKKPLLKILIKEKEIEVLSRSVKDKDLATTIGGVALGIYEEIYRTLGIINNKGEKPTPEIKKETDDEFSEWDNLANATLLRDLVDAHERGTNIDKWKEDPWIKPMLDKLIK